MFGFCDVLWHLCCYREDEKEKKDEKSYKSVFEQFGISKPTLQMNPFTGKVPQPQFLNSVHETNLRYMKEI